MPRHKKESQLQDSADISESNGQLVIKAPGRNLDDEGLDSLIKTWRPALQDFEGKSCIVDVSSNKLKGAAFLPLLQALRKIGVSIYKLCLHKNQLGDSAAKALAEHIRSQSSPSTIIKEIHLSGNRITRRGVLAMLYAVRDCGCYPRESSKGRIAMWLRIEYNAVEDPAGVLQEAADAGVRVHMDRLNGSRFDVICGALAERKVAEVQIHQSFLQIHEAGSDGGKKGKNTAAMTKSILQSQTEEQSDSDSEEEKGGRKGRGKGKGKEQSDSDSEKGKGGKKGKGKGRDESDSDSEQGKGVNNKKGRGKGKGKEQSDSDSEKGKGRGKGKEIKKGKHAFQESSDSDSEKGRGKRGKNGKSMAQESSDSDSEKGKSKGGKKGRSSAQEGRTKGKSNAQEPRGVAAIPRPKSSGKDPGDGEPSTLAGILHKAMEEPRPKKDHVAIPQSRFDSSNSVEKIERYGRAKTEERPPDVAAIPQPRFGGSAGFLSGNSPEKALNPFAEEFDPATCLADGAMVSQSPPVRPRKANWLILSNTAKGRAHAQSSHVVWSKSVASLRAKLEDCADLAPPSPTAQLIGKDVMLRGLETRTDKLAGVLLGREVTGSLADLCGSDSNLSALFEELSLTDAADAPKTDNGRACEVRELVGYLADNAKDPCAQAALDALLDFAVLLGSSNIRNAGAVDGKLLYPSSNATSWSPGYLDYSNGGPQRLKGKSKGKDIH